MSDNKTTYIKKAKLKGFKSIKQLVEISFVQGLNIIIGPNGSGKSNFLELVEKVVIASKEERAQLPKIDAQLEIIDRNLPLNIFDLKKERSFLDFRFPEEPLMTKINYNIPVLKVLDDNLSVSTYTDIIDGEIYHDGFVNFGTTIRIVSTFLLFSNFYFPKSDPEEYIKTKLTTGFNADEKITKAKINCKAYTPIEDFRLNEGFSVKINKDNEININYLRLEFLVNGEWLDWQQLSDGTKRLFYIVAEVTAHENTIILLEEPELGVHPHQLHKLMTFLKAQSKEKQIIISTHSPQVLNVLNSDELDRVIVAETTEKGTAMRHLTQKQINKAQKYMASELSLGDYWLHSDLEPQNTAL